MRGLPIYMAKVPINDSFSKYTMDARIYTRARVTAKGGGGNHDAARQEAANDMH